MQDPQPSGRARGFKGALKKFEFRGLVAWAGGCVEGDPESGQDVGGAWDHTRGGGRQRTPAPWRTGSPQPPPQWLAMSPPGLRLSGASSRSPQPYSPPIPGPSAPFIFLDSAWGFAGFWEIKTASNSGGVLPGQTGPGGPCALGYRLAAPSSGGRAQARAMPPRLCGGPLRSLWPQLQRRPGFLAQVVGGAVVACGQTLGALRGWVPLGLSRCVAGAVAPPSEVSGGAC